jgi:hypothetical protein
MTVMQEVVGRLCNIYLESDFIEMINLLDDPEYWIDLDHENLTNEECLDVLNRLSSIYSEWNKN